MGPEHPRSPATESLAGWMCLAESAADVSPGIGDVMRSACQLVRSAIDNQADNLAEELMRIMAATDEGPGISRRVLAATVREMLEADLTPLSPATAAYQFQQSIDELDDNDRALLREFGGAPEGAGDSITSQMIIAAGARIASEAAGVLAPRPGQGPDDYYFGGADARWFFTASLELPGMIGDRRPMCYFRPRHPLVGDKICITESTFNNRDIDNWPLRSHKGKPGEVDGAYRATLNDDEVIEFANILPNELRQGSYVCRAVIEPDSRAVRTVGRIVSDHRGEITSVADAAVQAAKNMILAVHPAGALALPLADLLAGLGGNICEHLVNALGRLIEPRSLPAWLISHTVVWADASPLSVFLIRCPDEPRSFSLHGIKQQSDGGGTQISADYRNLDKNLYNYGRLMWGASRPNVMLPGVPDDLWSLVDEVRQPVIWTNPEFDRRGFRVLVPQQHEKARYVTALRADIRFNKATATERVSRKGPKGFSL
jgi:hypothetical protein